GGRGRCGRHEGRGRLGRRDGGGAAAAPAEQRDRRAERAAGEHDQGDRRQRAAGAAAVGRPAGGRGGGAGRRRRRARRGRGGRRGGGVGLQRIVLPQLVAVRLRTPVGGTRRRRSGEREQAEDERDSNTHVRTPIPPAAPLSRAEVQVGRANVKFLAP